MLLGVANATLWIPGLEPARKAMNSTLLSVLYHHIGNLQRSKSTDAGTLDAIRAFKSALELRPLGLQCRQVSLF